MIHVLIGAACAFVLVKALRHRFGHPRFGHGFGPFHHRGGRCGGYGGYGGYGPWGEGPRGGGAYRERWIDDEDDDHGSPWEARRPWGRGGFGIGMNALFERLDASPAQEKAIRAAFDQLRTKARAVKDDARGMRGDLATAMRGESLDAETLGTVASRASGAIDGLRDAVIGALLKVHEVLDEKQRAVVADTLESGFSPFRGWRRGRG